MRERLLSEARVIWRNVLPESLRRVFYRQANSMLRKTVLQGLPTDAQALPGPLVVSGFLNEGFGIGRAGRMTVNGLRAAGYAPHEHILGTPLTGSGPAPNGADGAAANTRGTGGVWLMHCNPMEAIAAASRIPRAFWIHRYRIGYWAYELPHGPREWFEMARFFHEIWTPTSYVADAFEGLDRPVRVVPHYHGARRDPDRAGMRRRLEAGENELLVGAAGDLKSSETRKNLSGAIAIFKTAFETPSNCARLVIKLSSATFDPQSRARLQALMAGRPDIQLFEERLDDEQMGDFVASMDVFLSAHRAEGYGLTICEALLSDVAVLATGWSGNIDYMAGLEPMLINYWLVPARDSTGVYRPRARDVWAEPDIADGAAKLRRLSADPSLRREMCGAARAQILAGDAAWSRDALAARPWNAFIASETTGSTPHARRDEQTASKPDIAGASGGLESKSQ